MSDCFSGSDLGDWTGDCSSLDQERLPTAVESDQLTGADLILLATIPTAAIPLAEHLLHYSHPNMPRRIREEVLEVTRTVTMMEVVNAAPDKHPRSCEVTVTNIASDTGHPVSLKIRHMHQSQNVNHNEAQTQTPEITVEEETSDALRRIPNGTTRIEQEHMMKVERLKPPRRHASNTSTFNRPSDNLIDLHFTQPVLSEVNDQQHSAKSRGHQTNGHTVYSLYYRPFSEENSQSMNHSAGTAAPTVTTYRQPLKERSSIVDEIDLTSMASEASSNGSVIIYADPRPLGRASSAEGYFTTIPSNDSRGDNLQKAKSDGLVDRLNYSFNDESSQPKHNYIVTSLSQTQEKQRTPTVRLLYAELDALPSTDRGQQGGEVSRCDMNGGVSESKVFIHIGDEQVPCTSKSNGHVIFNRSSRSEPTDIKNQEASPPPNFDLSSQSPDEVYSDDYVPNLDEQDVGSEGDGIDYKRRCSTPPLMTSTPYTTLERKDRDQMDMLSDGRELRQSHSVPTILNTKTTADRSSLSSMQERKLVDDRNDSEGSLPRKRSSVTPIHVVNQERKSSLDFHDSGKKNRKATVNDIDWYAAFNMKEPSTPRSPTSVSSVDVMKGAEDVGEHSHRLSRDARSTSEKPLQPSQIDLDEVFCANEGNGGDTTKECNCKACLLTKLSDEERAKFTRQPPERSQVPSSSDDTQQRSRSANITQPVDISLDDVFSGIDSSADGTEKNGTQQTRIQSWTRISRSEEPTRSTVPLSSLPTRHDEAADSADWVEKLVQQEGTHEGPSSESAGGAPRHSDSTVRASYSEEAHAGASRSVDKTSSTQGEERDRRSQAVSPEEKLQLVSNGSSEEREGNGNTSVENSEEWLRSLVGEPAKESETGAEEPHTVMVAPPSEKGSKDDLKTEAVEDDKDKKGRDSTAGVQATCEAPEVTDAEDRSPQDDKSSDETAGPSEPQIFDESPERIHYPPHRLSLVGEVHRKPSVLEETSYNIDHLSPKDYVSKAYTQRLSQLKSQLGLEEEQEKKVVGDAASGSEQEPAASQEREQPVTPVFYTDEPAQVTKEDAAEEKMMSDEALIDAMFSEVLDGEASERTSLGADSISRKINPQEMTDSTENTKHTLEKSKSFDDWYGKPAPVDEEDVTEYVSDLLSQSLSEAIFSASQSLKRKTSRSKRGILITDTSFDKKLLEKYRSETLDEGDDQDSDENHHQESGDKKEVAEENRENSNEDPILKAVFTSSIDNQQFMESVISCPSSMVPSPRYASSALTTPGTAKTKDGSDVFFPSTPQPGRTAAEADTTFVSSASLMMNDTHSSSEGDYDDDHIIKLVFSDLPIKGKRTVTPTAEPVRIRQPNMETMDETVEESCQTPNSSVDSECFNADDRSTPTMDHRKTDDEMLEVEVFSDHFHIKGNYSLMINKDDPLGALLNDLHSKRTSSLDFSINPRLRRLLFQCLQEKSRYLSKGSNLISLRARHLLTDEDPSHEVEQLVSRNRFDADTNPRGNINFCTAANNLCANEMMAQLRKKGFSPTEAHLVYYPPAGGHSSTKAVMCRYMAEFMSATVGEDEVVILPSSISAYDLICHCTCEAGDIVLTSTPTYAASVRNCSSRAECHIRPVEMDMESPRLDVPSYQKALDTYRSKGESVRAVVIINPHNPLGVVFPPDDVIRLCDWATKNDLVVLMDESFASCVFGPSTFKSFLSYRHRLMKPENVFYLWSLSKDFGVPGLKISLVQSSSKELLESLSRLELIHSVSALAHDAASALLSDFEWLRSFHALKLARLSAHYEFLANNLREIGLRFTPAVAGCFVMIDFRKHLRSQTFEAEMSLWQRFCDRGVMLTPGQHVLCPQPGWMRLVFSCSKYELTEGINRLRAFFNLPPVRATINC
ncbi:hypothetical protein V3C99_013995 [Haemonchus contortus]